MIDAELPIRWATIKNELGHLRSVDGGFSQARRGLLALPDGTQVFVKLGMDENTKQWAKKEVAVYRFLQNNNYKYIPTLLSVNDDESAFAITAHTPEDGWNWNEDWTEDRINKTLEAMDALAALQPKGDDDRFFSEKAVTENDDGWKILLDSPDLRATLIKKLHGVGRGALADALDIAQEAKKSAQFVFRDDALVHNDVRADNCAWNPSAKEVKLVDWNWAQRGDRRIDLAATLTHVQKSGFAVLPQYASRLDGNALHWMAGFWFKAAATPIWEGGPEHLRDIQLFSGLTAWDLSHDVRQTFL
ncbi:MAG TPA: phosphotransferase [Candidatus Saccharimonadales bacterium]|nr:phosphotransferase [Candidatus Saccharimonadales bacterium]